MVRAEVAAIGAVKGVRGKVSDPKAAAWEATGSEATGSDATDCDATDCEATGRTGDGGADRWEGAIGVALADVGAAGAAIEGATALLGLKPGSWVVLGIG